MSVNNKLLKEQRGKTLVEGPFALDVSLLSKIQELTASSITDAALVSFATTIPAAAALPSNRAQAVAARRLAQEVLDHAVKENESDDISSSTTSKMIELLCDVITSAAARSIHRPLLWGLKTLSQPHLDTMHAYLITKLLQLINTKPGTKLDTGENSTSESSTPACDVTYTIDALLVFQEHIPVIEACAVPFAQHVVLSLERAVARACHASHDAGPLSYQLTEAVNDRIAVLYALLHTFNNGLARSIQTTVQEKKESLKKAEAAVAAALQAQDQATEALLLLKEEEEAEAKKNEDLIKENLVVSATVALHTAGAPPGVSPAAAVGAGVLMNTALLSTSASASSLYKEDLEPIDYAAMYAKAVVEAEEAAAEVHSAEAQAKALPPCICRAAGCLLASLKHGGLPNETMASAALALCSAITLPDVSHSVVVAAVGGGLLLDSATLSSNNLGDDVASGWVGSGLVQKDSSLAQELQGLGPSPALCMLRGLLQGSPLEALTASSTLAEGRKWNLMTDGVVGTLCHAISLAVDPEFKIFALQTLTICLDRLTQQWGSENGGKGAGKKEKKGGNGPLMLLVSNPALLTTSQQRFLLRVLWASWDDAQPRFTRLAQSGFAQLLKLVELQSHEEQGKGGKEAAAAFWESVARDLLALPADQKRRYAPLAAIVPHLGGSALLRLHPGIVEETLSAIVANVAVSTPAATMLRMLWSSLFDDALAKHKGDKGAAAEACRVYWAPQLAEKLCSRDDAARHMVCAYAVPVLVEIDPQTIEVLLASVAMAPEEVATPAVVSLLFTGRKLHLISDLDSISVPTTSSGSALTEGPLLDVHALLRRAVTHRSESLRAGALQLACAHPRTSALPTAEELALVQEALNVDLHTTSAAVRQNTIAPLARLFHRMRIAVGAILTRPRDFPPGAVEEVARCEAWLQSLSAGILASTYPGAQYGRRFMSVDVLCMLLEVFGDLLPSIESPNALRAGDAALPRAFRRKGPLAAMRKGDGAGGAKLAPGMFFPFPDDFFSASTVKLLLSCLLDSWDKIREGAAEALLLLPAPLPGIDTPEDVLRLMQLGLTLLRSPRLKDTDAGARIILLIFQQYVMGLGWRCGVHPATVHVPTAMYPGSRHGAVLDYLATMVALVTSRVEAGEVDLGAASRESLAHGPLLALRYLLPAVPWAELLSDSDNSSSTQAIASRLLSALQRLNNLILPVLSTPEVMSKVGAADVDANDVDFLTTEGVADDDFGEEQGQLLGPKAQVITCACWMNAKELALVIGTLCQQAPVVLTPPSPGDSGVRPTPALLVSTQLETAGEMLIRALIEAKHSGAVDKTQQGLEALASTLMGADSSFLADLPAQWLTRLLTHLRRLGQSRRDIIRRSAGLPYAIQALMRARPTGGSRVLAPRGFQELLATAAAEDLPECWPRVHAFNGLRMVEADTELGKEALPFHSKGLQVAISALAAPEWDVRNAAMLCYTSLLTRVLGFANLATKDVAGRRAATAADFFAAHPTLHPFLFGQLQRAAEDLEAGAKDLHPSLSPILTLLMRMKPATGAVPSSFSEAEGLSAAANGDSNKLPGEGQLPALLVAAAGREGSTLVDSNATSRVSSSPEDFIPLVQRCAAARPMFVRQQAAKALAPLVPAEKIAHIAGGLAAEISLALKNAETNLAWDANRVQGQLLQLVELLKVLGNTPEAAAHAAEVLASIATPLESISGACKPGISHCPPIVHAILRVAEAVAGLVVGTRCQLEAAISFISAASQHAWQGVVDTSVDKYNEIMLGVALKEATLLRLLWIPLLIDCLELSAQWVDEVATALQHSHSEVRASALKAALRLLGYGTSLPTGVVLPVLPDTEKYALRAVLELHAGRETHPKSLRRTLHVLSLLPAPPSQPGNSTEGTSSFTAMAQHAEHAADPITRAYALACLGPLLPNAASETLSVELAAATVTGLAQQYYKPDQLPELRSATVAMLGASGLLECPLDVSKKLRELQLGAWDALLCVLDDEDHDVRAKAAETAAAAMAGWEETEGTPPPLDACVEKVNAAVLPMLGSRLGSIPALLELLSRRVCDLEATRAALDQALETATSEPSALTGRLFEYETDNHHQEPLLQAQLAAQALAVLVPGLAKGSAENSEMLDWAVEAASILRDAAGTAGWQALSDFLSVSELDTAFSPAYSLVLAVWVGGHCRTEELQRDEMLGLFAELNSCGAFKKGLGHNPLLRALWSAGVRLWLGPPPSLVAEAIEESSSAPRLFVKPEGFLTNIVAQQDPSTMALLAELNIYEKGVEERNVDELREIAIAMEKSDVAEYSSTSRCIII